MIQSLLYYRTDNTVPFENLALEETLLHMAAPGQCILYLWQNRRTVVVGRNQDPFAECRVRTLEQDDGFLVRRLSGGGAVYHDMGNLNFTFLVRSQDYDVDRQLSVICRAVQCFGLDAQKTGRNDITVDGRKFSGNAFYKTGDCCYHHGTLLVDVDTGEMSRYLQVSQSKLASKGVASVRARVVNLKELAPEMTIDALAEALRAAFGEVYGLTPETLSPDDLDWDHILRRKEFFASDAWRFGARTACTDEAAERFSWGDLKLEYTVEGGRIRRLQLYSDGMEADFLADLPHILEGCEYASGALEARLSAVQARSPLQAQILADCGTLLRSRIE